jgi:hypothetical protein
MRVVDTSRVDGGELWAGKREVDRQARTYSADILLLAVILKAKSARESTRMRVTLSDFARQREKGS